MMDFGKYQALIDYIRSALEKTEYLHTIRVLNYALQILSTENEADADVVIAAAILHEIGRGKGTGEWFDLGRSHAARGSDKGYALLIENGYYEETSRHAADCILTHSLKSETPPQTLEAKIVFDADKLDMTGAVRTARAICSLLPGQEPFYLLDDDGFPLSGKKKEPASLIRDYRQRLDKISKVFHTGKAQRIALRHQKTMDDYFSNFYKEINKNHENGLKLLAKYSITKK